MNIMTETYTTGTGVDCFAKKRLRSCRNMTAFPCRTNRYYCAGVWRFVRRNHNVPPCSGKWRGTSDISIRLDTGTSLFIGNQRTPAAKTKRVQQELVNAALVQHNPEIISAAKETSQWSPNSPQVLFK